MSFHQHGNSDIMMVSFFIISFEMIFVLLAEQASDLGFNIKGSCCTLYPTLALMQPPVGTSNIESMRLGMRAYKLQPNMAINIEKMHQPPNPRKCSTIDRFYRYFHDGWYHDPASTSIQCFMLTMFWKNLLVVRKFCQSSNSKIFRKVISNCTK